MSTGHTVLPPDEYVASLARKRLAATAFFRDEKGRGLGRLLAVDRVPARAIGRIRRCCPAA